MKVAKTTPYTKAYMMKSVSVKRREESEIGGMAVDAVESPSPTSPSTSNFRCCYINISFEFFRYLFDIQICLCPLHNSSFFFLFFFLGLINLQLQSTPPLLCRRRQASVQDGIFTFNFSPVQLLSL